MALDLDALENYTQQRAPELVIASMFDAKTQKIIREQGGKVETGIKSSRSVNRLVTDVVLQADTGCGFTPSGTTEISQRLLTVGAIKVNEALCPKELNRVYLQEALKLGSSDEEIPFEEVYTTAKTGGIAEANEIAIWKGDTDSGAANLNKYDGFIKIIAQASGSVVHANAAAYISGAPLGSGTVITGEQAIQIVDGMYKALPAKVLGKSDVRI